MREELRMHASCSNSLGAWLEFILAGTWEDRRKTKTNNPVILLAWVCFVSFPVKDDLNLCECHPHLMLSLCQTTPG